MNTGQRIYELNDRAGSDTPCRAEIIIPAERGRDNTLTLVRPDRKTIRLHWEGHSESTRLRKIEWGTEIDRRHGTGPEISGMESHKNLEQAPPGKILDILEEFIDVQANPEIPDAGEWLQPRIRAIAIPATPDKTLP